MQRQLVMAVRFLAAGCLQRASELGLSGPALTQAIAFFNAGESALAANNLPSAIMNYEDCVLRILGELDRVFEKCKIAISSQKHMSLSERPHPVFHAVTTPRSTFKSWVMAELRSMDVATMPEERERVQDRLAREMDDFIKHFEPMWMEALLANNNQLPAALPVEIETALLQLRAEFSLIEEFLVPLGTLSDNDSTQESFTFEQNRTGFGLCGIFAMGEDGICRFIESEDYNVCRVKSVTVSPAVTCVGHTVTIDCETEPKGKPVAVTVTAPNGSTAAFAGCPVDYVVGMKCEHTVEVKCSENDQEGKKAAFKGSVLAGIAPNLQIICAGETFQWTAQTDHPGAEGEVEWEIQPQGITGQGETFSFTAAPGLCGFAQLKAECGGVTKRDSFVIVAVDEVTADKPCADRGEDITFTAKTCPPGFEAMVTWLGGGTPRAGQGASFKTKFDSTGTHTVTAKCGPRDTSNMTATVIVPCLLPPPGPPPPSAGRIQILAASDFIVPGSTLNKLRYRVSPGGFAFGSIVLQVLNKHGNLVRLADETLTSPGGAKVPFPVSGNNITAFYDGLAIPFPAFPLSEADGPYTYRLVGTDQTGGVATASFSGLKVEEHEMGILLGDPRPDNKSLTGRVDPDTFGALEIKVSVDGGGGPADAFPADIRRVDTPEGEEIHAFLDGQLSPGIIAIAASPEPTSRMIFYTTPTRESTIKYTIILKQVGKRVRDIAGNPWDMNPSTQDVLENKTRLRFTINPRGQSQLTNDFERTTEDTGDPITPEPPQVHGERVDD